MEALVRDQDEIVDAARLVIGPAGGPSAMFPLDFLVIAALKRSLSTSSAMRAMVSSWNMTTARSLLRMHIDTALRFSAAWFVSDPHAFAKKVIQGERIDKIKDKSGQKLTDTHLVSLHKQTYPWWPDVYANLCGYVHFSGAHIFAAVSSLDDAERDISFEASDVDLRYPDASWLEVLDIFREASALLKAYFDGYAHTKRMSASELAQARVGRR